MVLSNNSITDNTIFIVIPFMNASLNIYVNNKLLDLAKSEKITFSNNLIIIIVIKCIYDYIATILVQKIIYIKTRDTTDNFILRLNMSKINCMVPIPGSDQKTFTDLHYDKNKLNSFLIATTLLWFTVISFIISIINIDNKDGKPYQIIFTLLCIVVFIIMVYITDSSLYKRTKPSTTIITNFNDSEYVKLKLAMGCKLDTEFEKNKIQKQRIQQDYQKYLMYIINIAITIISIYISNISIIFTFKNIIWMLGNLADSINSFFYYDYVRDFIGLCVSFEKHAYISTNETNIDNFKSITFKNASFGYYESLELDNYTIKIINLTYTFRCGNLYYLESPNGIGKSTLLKMFISKLHAGNMFFDNVNRNNVSFDDIYKNIFHIVQASEYTPKFSREEVESFKGKDLWLEERLNLKDLLKKDSVEMSGGQKKRVYIYMALTSSCKVLLLDEILSELSTEETSDVPEGGGWLTRVLNTIIEWKGYDSKIIILVGHGLLNLIQNRSNVHKIKIIAESYNTIIENII